MVAIALRVCGIRLRASTWVVVAVCVLGTWITTDRTQFFVITLTGFFTYVYRHGRALSFARTVVAVMVCGALLAANFLIVGAWLKKTPASLGVTMRLPQREAPLGEDAPRTAQAPRAGGPAATRPTASPRPTRERTATRAEEPRGPQTRLERVLQRGSTLYLYATGSFTALDGLLGDEIAHTGGVQVVYPVARLLQRAGVTDASLPPAIPPFRALGMLHGQEVYFNGYTYLYYPVMDFGATGAIVYATLLGFLSGLPYAWLRRCRVSPVRLLIAAHVAAALSLATFVNKFNNTASWYVALATLLPFAVAALVGRQRTGARVPSVAG